MDFLRAHWDAQLIGASTLREELNPAGGGWDYGIDDEELRIYRQDALHLGRQKVIVLSGSGTSISLFASSALRELKLGSSPRVREKRIGCRSSKS